MRDAGLMVLAGLGNWTHLMRPSARPSRSPLSKGTPLRATSIQRYTHMLPYASRSSSSLYSKVNKTTGNSNILPSAYPSGKGYIVILWLSHGKDGMAEQDLASLSQTLAPVNPPQMVLHMESRPDVSKAVNSIRFSFKTDNTAYDYCALFILSHTYGDDKDNIQCSRFSSFSLQEDVFSKLTVDRCPGLEGKPVIAVVRAFTPPPKTAGIAHVQTAAGATVAERQPKHLFILHGNPEVPGQGAKRCQFIPKLCQLLKCGLDIRGVCDTMRQQLGSNVVSTLDTLDENKSFVLIPTTLRMRKVSETEA